ncbi:hypothetical protein M0R45_006644 [Rubus argutus]|uniref:2-hydroxyacyl-CoA lyase n=1 Tax=Rubus argutus TaxID=59490 RepID=A0AAW1YRQ0_RUBAR
MSIQTKQSEKQAFCTIAQESSTSYKTQLRVHKRLLYLGDEQMESTGIPFPATPMGKELLPNTHHLAATAARSLSIGKCDVALVVARLNWLLQFGEPPKWSRDVKFILINKAIKEDLFCLGSSHPWVEAISHKAKENVLKMEAQLAKEVVPFNFLTPMKINRDATLGLGSPTPRLVSEGANTMDVGRAVLVHTEPRTRLDAGTWGTMGVGLGYCIAGVVASPDRLVVAVEGDSGFGFSATEVETLVRYQLPVVVIVFNNGVRLIMIEAFGGKGYLAGTLGELKSALAESFAARKPAVINVIIDPYAGAENGRLQHKN